MILSTILLRRRLFLFIYEVVMMTNGVRLQLGRVFGACPVSWRADLVRSVAMADVLFSLALLIISKP